MIRDKDERTRDERRNIIPMHMVRMIGVNLACGDEHASIDGTNRKSFHDFVRLTPFEYESMGEEDSQSCKHEGRHRFPAKHSFTITLCMIEVASILDCYT